MCLDKSIYVNNYARLAIILRYAVGDMMRKELVKLASFSERTVMEAFLQDIRPGKVVSVTRDCAPCTLGTTSGIMQFFVKEPKHPVIQFHCPIHQTLCARDSCKILDNALKNVTKMLNYINGSNS
ncbi:uncharacterized protein LOC118184992 [Stegodyphus dumicola]|uniref:uncharacterized protein LOC118184992 n=1 Tax=Stegodyphus dumicola TaxID=202533 RepID=UPI0015A80F89|nr:uncharacterized protein LOC118184992 [Stegodyphus dumicola]